LLFESNMKRRKLAELLMLFTCLQKYSVESTAQLDSIMVCFEVQ
jgi:hypothetical protein